MKNKLSPISVDQEVWFCPYFEGYNSSLGLFLVKCKIVEIYILDGSKLTYPGGLNGIPCSALVNLKTDQDSIPEGCIVFYDIDEPIGHSIERDCFWALEEFDEDGIKEWISDIKHDFLVENKYKEDPNLDNWRSAKIAAINKNNNRTDLNVSMYSPKEKNKDWFVPS